MKSIFFFVLALVFAAETAHALMPHAPRFSDELTFSDSSYGYETDSAAGSKMIGTAVLAAALAVMIGGYYFIMRALVRDKRYIMAGVASLLFLMAFFQVVDMLSNLGIVTYPWLYVPVNLITEGIDFIFAAPIIFVGEMFSSGATY